MNSINIDKYLFYRSVYPPVESNMYILIDGNEAIVVDSNVDEDVFNLFKEYNINNVHVFLTHEHYDHSYGVCWMKEHFNTTLYCHGNSKGLISTHKNSSPRLVAFVLSAKDMNDGGNRHEEFKEDIRDYELIPDVYLSDGQTLNVAKHNIHVIHVPGHTPSSCLFVLDEKVVFSGDSLIADNKIITSFRGGNKDDMINIALPRLRSLPDELFVLPGHGEPFMKKEFDFSIYDV